MKINSLYIYFFRFMILLLLPSWSVSHILSQNIYEYTDIHEQGPMQNVVVDNKSQHVYIGARNYIYHFDSLLQLRDKVSTGPGWDNIQCLHPSFPCKGEKLRMDNDNKVLLIADHTDNPVLLTCSSLYQGLCQVRSIRNISRAHWVQPFDDKLGFTAGRDSTVAVFAKEEYNGNLVLISAATYDGRPLHYTPMTVSIKMLVQDEDGPHFGHPQGHPSRCGFDFSESIKPQYKVEYIAGFNHYKYSYFVSNQRISLKSKLLETRLTRVLIEEFSSGSLKLDFGEKPMVCLYKSKVYDIATAVYLNVGRVQSKNGRKSEDSEDMLYVSFLRTASEQGIVDGTKDSIICSFTMSDFDELFMIANFNRICYNSKKYSLEPDSKDNFTCQMFARLSDPPLFDCDIMGYNSESPRKYIFGKFRSHIEDHVTSLAVTYQKGVTIAAVGTSYGDIYKVKLGGEKEESEVLYIKNIAKTDQEDKTIQRSNAFDRDHQNIFFLTGNKVVKFPIGSCSFYTDCQTCLNSNDPLGCGWCVDHCAHQGECFDPERYNTEICTIKVLVYPSSGPIQGGTVITIQGSELGAIDTSDIQVEVAGSECKFLSREEYKIRCTSQSVPKPTEGPVRIFHRGIWHVGLSNKDPNYFTYVVPKLYGISPGKGPASGGTNVTLYGRHLNSGSRWTIQIFETPCLAHSVSENVAQCITAPLLQDYPVPYLARVEMKIDDATIEPEIPPEGNDDASLDTSFLYLPNPEIFMIQPNATTINSKASITVSGRYLDSVASPKMKLIFRVAKKTLKFQEPCSLVEDSFGTRMTCSTPDLRDHSKVYPLTENAPLIAKLIFYMDGTRDDKMRLYYYPDPEYKTLHSILKTNNEDNILEIEGKYLDLIHKYSDMNVTVGGDTVCNIIEISSEKLVCSLPSDLFSHPEGSKLPVEVFVGSAQTHLGFIELNGQESNLTLVVLLSVGILLICAGGILLLYCKRAAVSKYSPSCVNTCVSDWKKTGNQDNFHSTPRTDVSRNDYFVPRNRFSSQEPSPIRSSTIPEENIELEDMPSSEGEETEHLLHVENIRTFGELLALSEDTILRLQSEDIGIHRERLELAEVIGMGHFGCVYRGELKYPNTRLKDLVAVKTLRNNSSTERDVEVFIQEGLIMKNFHHVNVLTLLGVSFDDRGEPMIVLPFMKHGDLASYIRNENNTLTGKRLMTFGLQIATGMAYLARNKFVHRDLAARNCMLDEKMIVKIADFGLSRDVYEQEYYSSNRNMRLPVKWMAIESLEKNIYTSKTDVWSFGVVLWELMTRGVVPYPDVDNFDILRYLKSGRRLPQPSYCPNLLYELMLTCWNEDDSKRPTFTELKEGIRSIMTSLRNKTEENTLCKAIA